MLWKFSRWLPHKDPFCSIFLPLDIKIQINVDKCSVMRQSWNYKEWIIIFVDFIDV